MLPYNYSIDRQNKLRHVFMGDRNDGNHFQFIVCHRATGGDHLILCNIFLLPLHHHHHSHHNPNHG